MTAFALAAVSVALCVTALVMWRPARTRPRLSSWRTAVLTAASAMTALSGALDGNLWLSAVGAVLAAGGIALELASRRLRRKPGPQRAPLTGGGPE